MEPSYVGIVEQTEYDPNSSSSIDLIRWIDEVCRRAMLEKAFAQPSRKSLQIYNSAEGNNYICSAFVFNSMLPPQHTGSTARNVFLLLPLGLPRIAVAPLRVSFFAPRASGEETLQVQNWTKNNDVWTHRKKRKAAISWHGIT
ncbi:60S ribosomal protein L2, mitochondrial-like [Arachis stenosperma]|uniref:60S ribosomal protein L2, mitochondrial-like n=1 Tax=Arachis stenosperma TaxID=217475 RepID=UPI0025AC5510|nr:60S ribosomal protein L2, mitochondrial-like [Arachis stenosperma]